MLRAYLRSAAVVLAAGACAPSPAAVPAAPAPAPPSADQPIRAVRPVPVSDAFAAAIASGTRTEAGSPGPEYWQQRVSYRIEAELDPATAVLRGRERIVYHNDSPLALGEIALNLYQNVFSEGVPRNRYSPVTGGITLERVAAEGTELGATAWGSSESPGYSVRGTIGWIQLPRPVASGDSVVLEIDWRFTVPPEGTYRTGWQDAYGGRAFAVAQWYPQIATFDDVHRWDDTPYLGDGEFYLEYGDFDVALTVPAGWVVGGSGELQNPEAVLTDDALRRLQAGLAGEGTTPVVTAGDVAEGTTTRPSATGTLTWRFRAEDVRDFAFATSNRYRWDVARGGAGQLPIHALYRPGAPHWERAAEFGAHAIGFLSDAIVPYPYLQVTIAEGPIGGMEYPQIMFIGGAREVEGLYGVIAHEAVHFWFPMLVGSDEARYAWMDEGMASYYGSESSADFFGASTPHAANLRSYLAVAGSDAEVPMMRHTDLVTPYGARGVAAYTKPATAYRALRAVIGADRYDMALRQYVRDWTFRHPAPWDFFNSMERAAGRELDWFFSPWWFETATLDQAIGSVEPLGDGVRVTVRDLGEIPMPVYLVATTATGEQLRVEIMVESWQGMRTHTTELRTGSPVARVEIDPDALLPDVDRTNNAWVATTAGQ